MPVIIPATVVPLSTNPSGALCLLSRFVVCVFVVQTLEDVCKAGFQGLMCVFNVCVRHCFTGMQLLE